MMLTVDESFDSIGFFQKYLREPPLPSMLELGRKMS